MPWIAPRNGGYSATANGGKPVKRPAEPPKNPASVTRAPCHCRCGGDDG